MSNTAPMFKMTYQPWELWDFMKPKERETMCQAIVADPGKFYCPTGKQRRLLKIIGNCNKETNMPVVAFTANNAAGKSSLAAQIFLNIVEGPQNGYFDYPLFHDWPYPKTVWFISAATALKQSIYPEIERVFPSESFIPSKDGKGIVNRLIHRNGFNTFMYTTDQDPEQMESANVGAIFLDEPVSEAIWDTIQSRVRMGCIIFIMMTPLDVDPYLIDFIETFKDQGLCFHLTGEIYDTCMLRGKHGFIPPRDIDHQIMRTKADERGARCGGRFMYFQERIIGNFNFDRQVRSEEEFPVNPQVDLICHAMDPHDNRPNAVIYIALKKNNRRVVFGCLPGYDGVTPYWEMRYQPKIADEVKEMIELEERFHIKECFKRKVDKRYAFTKHGEKNLAQLYAAESRKQGKPMIFSRSYSNTTSESELSYGHRIIRELCEDNPDDGEPNLIIHRSCYHVWNAIQHYVRKRARSKAEKSKAIGETVIVERYKDFIDVLRYGLCVKVYGEDFAGLKEDISTIESEETEEERNKKLLRKYLEEHGPLETNGTTNILFATIRRNQ